MGFHVEISSAVISAVISALGVIVAAFVSKREAEKTARTTSQAEIEKFKMQIDHENQIRREDSEKERMDRISEACGSMVSAVTAYRNMHDRNYKNAAEASIQRLIAISGTSSDIEHLLNVVRNSDPFNGPYIPELDSALNKVLIEHSKKFGH